MKIGIDISRTVTEATGVGYYAKNLVHALAGIDSQNEYLLYGIFCECSPPDWKSADTPAAENFSLHQKRYPSSYVAKKWANFGKHKERLLGGVNILHSTAYTTPLISGPKIIVTIHDLSFFVYPQHHTDANYQFVTRNVHHAARRAHFIIADSENTRREIKRFLHVPDERVEVVHLAAGEMFFRRLEPESITQIKNKYGIRKPYFLALGSIEPRKNLARALVAFKALLEFEKVDYQFVMVGGSGWKNEAFYSTLKKLNIDEHLLLTGYVPEEDLPALYQGAEVFIYPSIYEGFGLPVLEAMASGVPVITSNTSSLPEVAGDAALLVNPGEVFEIYEAMEALVSRPSLIEELKSKGIEQSKKFSWEKTARETLKIYERAYGGSGDSGQVERPDGRSEPHER
jgi:glycosyltransferase involved in cell wall biosynthesis